MKKLFLTLVMVVLSLGLIFVGTQETAAAAAPAKPTSTPTPTVRYGGVLKILYSRDHVSFGYPPLITGIGISLGRPALEPLLDFDSDWNFKPTYLATNWKVAPDGLSATITLRKGVKFHDGTDFNAEAVKWNLEKEKENKVSGTDTWKSIEVVDNYTVRIHLTRFDVTLPQILSFSTAPGFMVSPTAYAKNGQDWMMTHPVGTGPYKLKSFTQDVSAIYERFEDYWGGKPYLDGVEYHFMTDAMVQTAALRSGAGHVAYTTIPQYAKELKDLGYNVAAPMNSIITINPDSRNADSPMANQKVREALEYAIDREAIAKLGFGYWRAAYQWAMPEYPMGYNADLQGRKYNPAKAKQLLAEAGYPNGFKTTLIADVTHNLMDPLTAVQSYWKAVGVDAAVNQFPRVQYVALRSQGWNNGYIDLNNLVVPMYISVIPKLLPAQYTRPLLVSTLKPPGYAEAIAQAVGTRDFSLLKARTQAVVKMLYDNATVLPLYSLCDPIAMDKSVRDSGFGGVKSVYLWSPEKVWLNK